MTPPARSTRLLAPSVLLALTAGLVTACGGEGADGPQDADPQSYYDNYEEAADEDAASSSVKAIAPQTTPASRSPDRSRTTPSSTRG